MTLKRKPTDGELVLLRAAKARAKQLMTAAATGDIAAAQAVLAGDDRLRLGHDPSRATPPLAIAAREGQLEFLRWGLREIFGPRAAAQPQSNQRDALLGQCAAAAARNGRVDILAELELFGADLGAPLLNGLSVLDFSIQARHPMTFSFCASKWTTVPGDNPLHSAIECSDCPMDAEWAAAILCAAKSMHPSALQAHGNRGLTALALCAELGHHQLIAPLAALGAGLDDPGASSHTGLTPLMLSTKYPECVKTLLALGADESMRCARRGWNAARHAFHKLDCSSALILMKSDPGEWWSGDPDSRASALWDGLAMAGSSSGAQIEASELPELLERMIRMAPSSELALGALPASAFNRIDKRLHISAPSLLGATLSLGLQGCFDALIERGIDPNGFSTAGDGPLAQAMLRLPLRSPSDISRSCALIDFAISRGADPSFANADGDDLLTVALDSKAPPAMLLLAQSHLDMASKRKNGWSTLAEMALRAYGNLDDYPPMALAGSALDEISDWMHAAGVARGAQNEELASFLMSRALVAKEKWALCSAIATPSLPNIRLGRL